MNYSTRDIQARLAALGFHPGPIDGQNGPRTLAAFTDALKVHGGGQAADLFHRSGLHRVHWHWTAGAYGVIDIEEESYNALIDKDGKVHPGQFPPKANARYMPGRAASHTLNANTGAIGISVDCMGGAQERPFRAGKYPMTWGHVEGLVERTAYYCDMFWIPVTRYSVLSHAEIQPTLGIRQRFKWDITWLPDMDRLGDPIEVGDRLRAMVIERMGGGRIAA